MKKESFVFHAEYIDDLPDDYKACFSEYIIKYGLYGELPPLMEQTLEYTIWQKIQRRIDAEAQKYAEISEKRREAAQQRYAQRYTEEAKAEPKKQTSANNAIAEIEEQPKAKKKLEQKEKRATFTKPTVEEIDAYCSERKNGIDPQAFFDFYESKGWKVGAVKMKDWRASVRTWEQRHKTESGGRNKAGGMWGKENEIPDEITDLF